MTPAMPSEDLRALASAARPLTGGSGDYDALLDAVGDARFVLIGEASHGTHEFYNERARITERLIDEKGFHAVAAEADWPDAYRVNRFLRGHAATGDGGDEGGGDEGEPDDALRSLGGFERFPLWMWRNRVVLDFVADAAARNATLPERDRAGFYGLDLYSLYGSIEEVVRYLEGVDPEAARRARDRYGCLEEFGSEPQDYGRATEWGGADPCEEEAVAQLTELLRRAGEFASRDGQRAEDAFFYAEQNARLVVNAEEYYRAMYRGARDSTWNLRDTHMADTLDALDRHLTARHGKPAKIVVWAHNSHLGDARATEMGEERAELNLGQLCRERHPGETFLVGFTSYDGTVTAADDWGEPARLKAVNPGMAGSYEALFHLVGAAAERTAGGSRDFWLDLRDPAVRGALPPPRLERAIGVIYRPGTERWSHYFRADLARQFDAVLHFDRTRAVEPLERTPGWTRTEGHGEDVPETYPTGV